MKVVLRGNKPLKTKNENQIRVIQIKSSEFPSYFFVVHFRCIYLENTSLNLLS